MEASMELMKAWKQDEDRMKKFGYGVWQGLSSEVSPTLKEGG